MDFKSLITAIFIATGFVAWPIVGKFSKLSGAWVGTIILVSTGFVVALLSVNELRDFSVLNLKALICLLVAGAINGLACYLYSIKATDQIIQAGLFVALVSILMVMMAPILDLIFNDTMITLKQGIGFFLGVITVYLLTS